MKKTLYIRTSDMWIWSRASELAGGELAPIISKLLLEWIDRKTVELKSNERAEYYRLQSKYSKET